MKPGNRRVHVHLAVTSPTIVGPGEDLGNDDLVARYADPATGLRYRQIWPKHITHSGALDLTPAGPERVEPDVLRSVVKDRGGGMQVEEYHGYTIRSEPGRAAGAYEVYWLNVGQRDDEVFRLEMRVSRFFTQTQTTWPTIDDATELAALLGRRWVHGLIHLGRVERSVAPILEERIRIWNPLFGEASTSEDDLRREVLAALHRMYRAQQNTPAILSLDVDGVADVLGVRPERVRETLGDLELEKLIESHYVTFGHGLNEGACRITAAGRSELRMLEQRRTRPTVRPSASAGEEYDVFISHASEDKEAVARPLAERLRAAGLRVWYDDFTLTLGDSLRRSIERGLAKSRFGVVILGSSFFAKAWPQEELNGLFAREIGGVKVILPIWHELGRAELLKQAPMLADKVAARTSDGLDVVVVRILEVVHIDAEQAT